MTFLIRYWRNRFSVLPMASSAQLIKRIISVIATIQK